MNSEKQIGIVTFHRAHNYGAVLQSYALFEVIKKYGCNVHIIDYRNRCIEYTYRVKIFPKNSSLKGVITNILMYKIKKRKYYKFERFINNSGLTDKVYYTFAQLANIDYDIFITGSDQVWNYKCSNEESFSDKSYFLNFVKDAKKKYSYAASFGFNEIPNEYKEDYLTLLKDISKISVREKQGAVIIKDLLGIDVPVVLDPTMLLGSPEWEKIAVEDRCKEKYILMYLMANDSLVIEYAKKLSKEKGLKVMFINDSILKKQGLCNVRCVGPSEWVGLFKKASYIVTNSFHGVAFAINFNKEFFVSLLPHPWDVNSRLLNIIDMFGLKNRMIVNGMNEHYNEKINYNMVNKILKEEREKSTQYIKSIIGDEKNEQD